MRLHKVNHKVNHVQLNKQTDRRVDQTPDECAYSDVQADGGAAWLAAPRPTDDECHADHSDDDGRST